MVHTIYFSPALSTRKVVQAVAAGISDSVTHHDITQGIKTPIGLTANDIVVIGIPSYSGRVPVLASEHLSQIQGNGSAAILVCVYGNREFEDTLLELKNICTDNKFNIVSAAAFLARHSIFPNIAQGRPDEQDLTMARDFGCKSQEFALQKIITQELHVSGNQPYRKVGKIPITPHSSAKCNACGICAAKCPTGAIDKDKPRRTDKRLCISCGRCIELCPQKARGYSGLIYKIAQRQFAEKFSRRKEIELFYPQK